MDTATGDLLVNEIAPRLDSLIAHSIVPVGVEDLEELRQDGIAMAAKLLARCVETGKRVTPGNVAFYTVRLLRAGRRSTGCTATDVMAPMTRRRGRAELVSTEQPLAGEPGEQMTLADVLADEREDPATEALRHLAWEELERTLDPRENAVAVALAEGRGLRATAREHGVSPSAMSSAKASLGRRIREEWGPGVLAESARQPFWKARLHAEKERRSGRWERRLR